MITPTAFSGYSDWMIWLMVRNVSSSNPLLAFTRMVSLVRNGFTRCATERINRDGTTNTTMSLFSMRIGGEPDTLRDLHARKLGLVFAVPENRLDDLFRNVPDGDLVLILICCDGETDSKAACAENGDFCHMNLLVF